MSRLSGMSFFLRHSMSGAHDHWDKEDEEQFDLAREKRKYRRRLAWVISYLTFLSIFLPALILTIISMNKNIPYAVGLVFIIVCAVSFLGLGISLWVCIFVGAIRFPHIFGPFYIKFLHDKEPEEKILNQDPDAADPQRPLPQNPDPNLTDDQKSRKRKMLIVTTIITIVLGAIAIWLYINYVLRR